MTLKICPSCGHKHDSADVFCPYCKHSYSEKKVVCSNCGAYLRPLDKYCYVCDTFIEGDVVSEITPDVEQDFADTQTPTEEVTYNEDNVKEDEVEKSVKAQRKPKSKKGLILVAVFLIIAFIFVGVSYYSGFINNFGTNIGTKDNKIKVYFNKPLSNVNLLDDKGIVYNWSGDVQVNYTVEDSNYSEACKLTLEYESMWFCNIPATATNIYFSQMNSQEIKTVKFKEVSNDTVYYVSDILFDKNMQLPLMSCSLKEFTKQGINYSQPVTTAPTTEVNSESESSSTEETTESETESVSNSMEYDISIPQEWKDNIEIVTNENCIEYVERYNYSNYQCGKLFSIYFYEANDNSYSDMNVKKIITRADNGGKIVVVTPTDIQFNDVDDKAIEKYTKLSQFTQQVIDSIQEK